ncbi:MAG TPA: hypothetical protein VM840_03460 [Actinomycetota bacterium]|nr:hypothetical protein [Actinomycetota bacterium]
MRSLIAAAVVASVVWPAPAGAVTCSPGRSELKSDFSHPAVPEVPVRVYGGWTGGGPISQPKYLLLGVRDRQDGWRIQGSATTERVVVDGDHVASDTGFQVRVGTDGSAYVCGHAAGQTVEQGR